MLLKFIDRKIRQAFSDSAYQYEVLANLQKEIGRELVKKIDIVPMGTIPASSSARGGSASGGKIESSRESRIEESFTHILDVGMGTGWLTNRLSLFFPEAKVVGLDFADGMLEHAKKKEGSFAIVQANARSLPFPENTFDIIVSNLAYQWVEDLEQAFRSSYGTLKSGGKFYVTMFGQNTLKEMFVALERSLDAPGQALPMKRLADRSQIEQALKEAGFPNVEISCESIKVHFEDLLALMKWLKKIGANISERNVFVGKDLLARANDYYKDHFKDSWGVYASFEIIWIKALKEEKK